MNEHDQYCELKWDRICMCEKRHELFDKKPEYKKGFLDGSSAVGDYIKRQGLRHVEEKRKMIQVFKKKLSAETHKAFTKGFQKGSKVLNPNS